MLLKTGLLPILCCLLLGLATAAARPPATTIYLVRHAEKDLTPGLADPPLTPGGEARAQLLARHLAKRHPAALFTTDTRRTRATLAPLAQATGLTPEVYSAREPAALAGRLQQQYAGKTVVVVGHSNTLLPLLAALGVAPLPAEIRDEEYNYLFKVTLRAGQPARLIMSRYGAAPQAASAGGLK
ncbi:histidine phosphatase family protein [Hymenobacter cheonanensis]|uniref:histidine phosphatase family protein n=1 Tax=Hymenobacter sp. CA2-7 TaxID=3063993 RepID=UPI00271389B6|nr:histidine phosphatase family protein [Hymenobacter sp. CA2-7]MDO7887196.1 histidine phosphatase family protein [Hymenobacter sp. CA2-7]